MALEQIEFDRGKKIIKLGSPDVKIVTEAKVSGKDLYEEMMTIKIPYEEWGDFQIVLVPLMDKKQSATADAK